MKSNMKSNILITSVGRRTTLLEYFKKEFTGDGEVHVTDCSPYAPGLFYGDKAHVVPRVDDPAYLDTIFEICRQHEIKGILSLIDPELAFLGKNSTLFEQKGIVLFGSPYEISMRWFDKMESFQYFELHKIPTPRTFDSLEDALKGLKEGEVKYPLIMKPRYGSASLGVHVVKGEEDLLNLWSVSNDYIIQERIEGEEFGIDAYIDLYSDEVIDLFIKKKILMRAGETDKAISIENPAIEELVKELLKESGIKGPVDLDILEEDGRYYVLEVNPRFGGGYPLAYECGCNFPGYILENLKGKTNKLRLEPYETGTVMMKHDRIHVIRGEKYDKE